MDNSKNKGKGNSKNKSKGNSKNKGNSESKKNSKSKAEAKSGEWLRERTVRNAFSPGCRFIKKGRSRLSVDVAGLVDTVRRVDDDAFRYGGADWNLC